ncbi:hypothetical protein [Kutzneria albida]|uniref:Tetratricopeptide repeat protein n=1 Tax=Kutzneria albida DSM 43870 TaxID=1449976 RepID=W5W4F6_9PSEU|nr:hypothetical protein [Kutzneria albida]AHH95635.1 hypothetical protein KALB_2266 [Kutzneria albida DSM 43870]
MGDHAGATARDSPPLGRAGQVAWGKLAEELDRLNETTRVLPTLPPDQPVSAEQAHMWTAAAWSAQRAGELDTASWLWQQLLERQRAGGGERAVDVLVTTGRQADGFALCGRLDEAVEILHGVRYALLEQLGPHDPVVLACRVALAEWRAEAWQLREASHLIATVAPQAERQLGEMHRTTRRAHRVQTRLRRVLALVGDSAGGSVEGTLSAVGLPDGPRTHVRALANAYLRHAYWTGIGGDSRRALRLLIGLHDQVPARWRLPAMENVAALTLRTGAVHEAISLLAEVISHCTEEFGTDHPRTLALRAHHAHAVGLGGEPARAARLAADLVRRQRAVLGGNHVDLSRGVANLAYWQGERKPGGLVPPDPYLTRVNIQLLHDFRASPNRHRRGRRGGG